MLNYFRINDPYRLIAVTLIIGVIRLPYYLFAEVLQLSDIRYFALGEKIAHGSWLNVDFLTTESVLSGMVFGILHFVFGPSLVAFHILAFIIILVQVFLFNRLVSENRATESQSYFPGLFYGLFISLFPASYTLTPQLIGQTFLLIALNFQFNHLEFRVKRDEKIITIGLCLGVYGLLLGPAMLYMITALLVFILYTNTLFRRYLLMSFGFLLPFFLVWGAYLLSGKPGVFLPSLRLGFDGGLEIDQGDLWMMLFPALFFLKYLPSSLLGRRFTNYQMSLNQAMFIWFLFSIAVFWLGRENGGQAFIMLVPVFALYATHYFLVRRSWRSVIFFFQLVIILSLNTVWWLRPEWSARFLGDRVSMTQRYATETAGKSVLVLGPDIREYRGARQAGRFFDWELAEPYFSGPLDHFKIVGVYEGLVADPPDIIVDKEGLLERYLERIPELEEIYRREGELWIRINS